MDKYGKPELLSKEEYEKFISYIHLTKNTTSYIRDRLNRLENFYHNEGIIGIMSEGKLIIEILLLDNKNLLQLILDKNNGDFKIFHSSNLKIILPLDVRFLMMRIGGVSNNNILTAFAKDEIRFMVYKSDENNSDTEENEENEENDNYDLEIG